VILFTNYGDQIIFTPDFQGNVVLMEIVPAPTGKVGVGAVLDQEDRDALAHLFTKDVWQ
jgi:hypothetical protein